MNGPYIADTYSGMHAIWGSTGSIDGMPCRNDISEEAVLAAVTKEILQ